ncbi:hypothetical protein AB0M97_23560 [Streptomyces sp. NPDC051207]|uniref:hypothetical protein n=1 Tax=Streptomyces sp. NPDC051207 TaxID=3154641 RepID=UPI003446354B
MAADRTDTDTDSAPQTEEPRIRVRGPAPVPVPARRPVWRRVLPLATALVTTVCAIPVIGSGHTDLPFRRIITIEAKMASKSDFFQDPEVRRLLAKHGFTVHLTRMGSRGIATQNYESYDIVFPSGQPAADLITRKRAAEGRPASTFRPFVSPIVLGTYREYARTLEAAKLAEPMPGTPEGAEPLYYSLKMEPFLQKAQDGTRWHDLKIERQGIENHNKVLAQTSDICESNSAGTYLGLVSYVRNGATVPQSREEADRFADRIKLLLNDQGLPSSERNETYVSPEGKSIAPIAVIYEHQFVAHQLATEAETGKVDDDRVLLYPSVRFVTEPQLIALTPEGERLGRLISDDPELQHRATELGFRVRDADSPAVGTLDSLLKERGIQVPVLSDSDTKAVLPRLGLLERMIERVGECPAVPQPATGKEAP